MGNLEKKSVSFVTVTPGCVRNCFSLAQNYNHISPPDFQNKTRSLDAPGVRYDRVLK